MGSGDAYVYIAVIPRESVRGAETARARDGYGGLFRFAQTENIDLVHVTSDDSPTWDKLHGRIRTAPIISIKDLITKYGKEIWGTGALMKYPNDYGIILWSHYDNDEEFRDAMGHRKFKPIKAARRKKPMKPKKYAIKKKITLTTRVVRAMGG